jgi:hypothetical protein
MTLTAEDLQRATSEPEAASKHCCVYRELPIWPICGRTADHGDYCVDHKLLGARCGAERGVFLRDLEKIS